MAQTAAVKPMMLTRNRIPTVQEAQIPVNSKLPVTGSNSPGTTVLARFQCPPRQTAETIQPVLPARRYSICSL